VQIDIDEAAVPVQEAVRGACEMFGLDPLYVANEGRFIAFVPATESGRALALLRGDPTEAGAQRIGQVVAGSAGLVTLRSRIGAQRILDLLSGDCHLLPRIC
jgi:hydrogenase expression/formation protein HypE